MDDSDNSGPLSQLRKRRRISRRSTRGSDHEALPGDSEGGISGGFGHEVNRKEELDARIAELKGWVQNEKRQSQQRSSAAAFEIGRLRSALTAQSQEYSELKERIKRKQDEVHHTNSELLCWEEKYENSKAATSGRDEMLLDAMKAIQDLENLATELPRRLQQSPFESRDSSILSMLSSFYREICQKYFGQSRTQPLGVAKSDHSTPHDLDEVQKRKLTSVLRGLRTHSSYHIFAQPVTENDAPDYFEIIKQPMDLSIIRRKLESDEYQSLTDFVSDVKLMFENCREYNGDSSAYGEAANRFEQQMWHLMENRGLPCW